MPSNTGRSERKDRDPAEEHTATCPTVGRLVGLHGDRVVLENDEFPPRRMREQVRILVLASELAIVERERATLAEQTDTLETEIENREETITSLEETIDRQDNRLQRVVDQYERILVGKERVYQEHVEQSESSIRARIQSVMKTIRSLPAKVLSWVRRASDHRKYW